MMTPPNVFYKSDAVASFFNPNNYPDPPFVEIPSVLNPFTDDDVDIYASCAYYNHGNIKMYAAYNMLQRAKSEGKIAPGHVIVESTSGNMGLALGKIARHFGCRVKIIVSDDTAPGRLESLRHQIGLSSVEPVPSGAIERAKEYGRQPGFFHVNQYANAANPDAITKWYAPVIWRQARTYMTVFAAALGTTGTMVGVGQFLDNEATHSCYRLGVHLAPEKHVPGVRDLERLKEVSLPWQDHVTGVTAVDSQDSYQYAFKLNRLAGLYVGPSSGLAFCGLLQWLKKSKESGELDDYRNDSDGRVVAVFVCADSADAYLDKFSTFCPGNLYKL